MSRSTELASKLIFKALNILKDNNDFLSKNELFEKVELYTDLDDWAKERYEKTGYIRWQSTLLFYSINLIKASFIRKNKGVWYITPEGKEALHRGEKELFRLSNEAYQEFKNRQKILVDSQSDNELEINESEKLGLKIEDIEQTSYEVFKEYLSTKNGYEFQDISAALLRGMGYFTPYVAAPGKDGGIDVIAYRDPLGAVQPRIKVQIKHRQNSASVDEIRQLMGLLQKDGDVGIFISSGGFTPDALKQARNSIAHIELIDFERFISLWQQFYEKMSDDDKVYMPLKTIKVLAIEE